MISNICWNFHLKLGKISSLSTVSIFFVFVETTNQINIEPEDDGFGSDDFPLPFG